MELLAGGGVYGPAKARWPPNAASPTPVNKSLLSRCLSPLCRRVRVTPLRDFAELYMAELHPSRRFAARGGCRSAPRAQAGADLKYPLEEIGLRRRDHERPAFAYGVFALDIVARRLLSLRLYKRWEVCTVIAIVQTVGSWGPSPRRTAFSPIAGGSNSASVCCRGVAWHRGR